MCKFESLTKLAAEVHALATEKGWHSTEKEPEASYVPKAVANLHGEVSELWEAYRAGRLDEQCDKGVDLSCLQEELADVVIRALDAAHELGVDIGYAVRVKHGINKTRPVRHGNKVA